MKGFGKVVLRSANRFLEYSILLTMHFANHILNSSLPFLILFTRDDLDLGYTEAGILISVMIVVMTIVSVPVGYYSDFSYRIRYLFIFFSLAIMGLGWMLISIATSYFQLIIFFGIIGLGASGFHPPASAIITDLFEKDKGKALSVNMITGMVGSALSPLIFAGLVNLTGSWESASIIIAVFGFGILLVSLSASVYLKIFNITNQHREEDNIASVNGKGSMLFLLSPLILLPIAFISIRSAIFRISTLFTGLLFEDYLSLTKEDATVASAIVLGVATLFIVIGGFVADHYTPRIAILISSIGNFISGLALVYLVDFNDVYFFGFILFAINATFYLGSPAMSTMLADRVNPSERGKLFGSLFSIGQVFSMFVPVLFGWIRDNEGIDTAFKFILSLTTMALVIGVYIYVDDRKRTK